MKAAVIREFGDVDVLKVEEVPTPEPQPGEILDGRFRAVIGVDLRGTWSGTRP